MNDSPALHQGIGCLCLFYCLLTLLENVVQIKHLIKVVSLRYCLLVIRLDSSRHVGYRDGHAGLPCGTDERQLCLQFIPANPVFRTAAHYHRIWGSLCLVYLPFNRPRGSSVSERLLSGQRGKGPLGSLLLNTASITSQVRMLMQELLPLPTTQCWSTTHLDIARKVCQPIWISFPTVS